MPYLVTLEHPFALVKVRYRVPARSRTQAILKAFGLLARQSRGWAYYLPASVKRERRILWKSFRKTSSHRKRSFRRSSGAAR